MSTSEIRSKLHSYIELAQDKKIKALYTIIEGEIELSGSWNDKVFIAEINKRINELETGKVKGYSWPEVKAKAMKSIKTIKTIKSH